MNICFSFDIITKSNESLRLSLQNLRMRAIHKCIDIRSGNVLREMGTKIFATRIYGKKMLRESEKSPGK